VDQVAANVHRQVGADGARRGVGRVGRPDRLPDGLDCLAALPRHHHHRAGGDVTEERLVKAFAFVNSIMLRRQFLADGHELHRGEPQTPALQPGDDLPRQSPLHPVGLDDDE